MSDEVEEVTPDSESKITLTVTPEGLRIDTDLNVADVYFVLGQAMYMITAETFA